MMIYLKPLQAEKCLIMSDRRWKCREGLESDTWSVSMARSVWGGRTPYRLDDLHVPHRLVRSNSRPVRQLLVPSSFNVEAVGERAELEPVSIWQQNRKEKRKKKGRRGEKQTAGGAI